MKLTLACCLALLVGTQAFRPQGTVLVRPTTTRTTPLFAYLDVREDVERDLGTMDEWATACGVQRADGFQLTTEDGQDWSVMTTSDIPAQTPILYVPADMILSSSRCLAEMGDALQPAVDALSRLGAQDQQAMFVLWIKLLTMYEMGDQPPWYPWLNSLPRLFYNAPSMTSKFVVCCVVTLGKMRELMARVLFTHARTHFAILFLALH